MRSGNKRAMWPQAQALAGMLAPEGALAQAAGVEYAAVQADDTRARQAALDLYRAFGAYGLAAAATAYAHDQHTDAAPVLRRLVSMLPARYQRAAHLRVADVAADGSASPGVVRCALAYLARYVTSAAQIRQHAAYLVTADRIRQERARAERQRVAAGALRRGARGVAPRIGFLAWTVAAGAAAASAVLVVRIHP